MPGDIQESKARIWNAFVGVRSFLRQGLWESIQGQTSVDPRQWAPVWSAVRVVDEEELHVPPEVTALAREGLRGIERDLNRFLDVLRDYIEQKDLHDEAHWLARFNGVLDLARTNFQTCLDRLKPMLSPEVVGTQAVSVLFVAADPSDEARLRLGREFREIHEKLRLASQRDRFRLEIPQLSLRPEDLSQALLDVRPTIVHFSGHGGDDGALCFEDASGNARPVGAAALALLFSHFTQHLQCVVLNACYSAPQAKAIARHVPFVVGMSDEIGDDAAIAFAVGFYQGLGAGRSIEQAYRLGCAQIAMQGIPEHLTPTLSRKRR